MRADPIRQTRPAERGPRAIPAWVPAFAGTNGNVRSAMRADSLALRLFLSATVWTVVILLVTGFALSGLYRDSVERGFDRRLGVYLKTLIADIASPEIPIEKTGQMLGEPLFELPLSGWYWQVTRLDRDKPVTLSSRSLWDRALPHLDSQAEPERDGTRKSYVQGPEDQRLRLVERNVDLGDEGRYQVAVAGDAAELDDEILAFDGAIATTFVVLAVVLLLTTLFQVRFGLAPLNRISRGLRRDPLRQGREAGGQFPGRDRPAGARDQRADRRQPRDRRARAHPCRKSGARAEDAAVGDGERGLDPAGRSARRQGARADRHHARPGDAASRARAARRPRRGGRHHHRRGAGGAGAGAHAGEDSPRQEPHHRSRPARRGALSRRAAGSRGDGRQPDRQRLQVGAVAGRRSRCCWSSRSPAGRWCGSSSTTTGRGFRRRSASRWRARGQRLDETKPGSGLGLSIVVELAALYGGALNLGTAPIGGLRAELVLPAGIGA